MATRGRKPGFVMPEEHRLKISKSNILSRLIKCAEGEIEMSSVQANVALGLMRKVMPDLASVEHSGEVETSYAIRSPLPDATSDEWQKKHNGHTVQ